MDIQILETASAPAPAIDPPYLIQRAALGEWWKVARRWTEEDAQIAAAKVKEPGLVRIVWCDGDRRVVLPYVYSHGKRIDAGKGAQPKRVPPMRRLTPAPAVVAPPVVASTRPRLNPWHPEPALAMGTVEIDGRVFEIVWNGCR